MEHDFQHGDEVKYVHGKTKYPKLGDLIVQRVTADYIVCTSGRVRSQPLNLTPNFCN